MDRVTKRTSERTSRRQLRQLWGIGASGNRLRERWSQAEVLFSAFGCGRGRDRAKGPKRADGEAQGRHPDLRIVPASIEGAVFAFPAVCRQIGSFNHFRSCFATHGLADWPSVDRTRKWRASHPGDQVPVCGQCAALRKWCCLPLARKGRSHAWTMLVSPSNHDRNRRRANVGNQNPVVLQAFQRSHYRKTGALPTFRYQSAVDE